jgi:hypothetical protein
MTQARRRTALAAGAAVLAAVVGASGFASAQVDCDTMVGPARSDCYIGVARIQRQKSEIAASVARQRTDAANLYRVTRKRPKTIPTPKQDGD